MNYFGAFTPCNTANIAATAIGATDVTVPGVGNILRVVNSGTTLAFVRTSPDSQDADPATSLPVMGGDVVFLVVPEGTLTASAIMASGTATIYCTRGTMG